MPTWQTNGVVRALASSQGKVVAVGEFTQIRPGSGQSGSAQNVAGLAIFDAATGQPATCQLPAALTGGTARLYTAEASPDGQTVFVGGNFNSIGGVGRTRLAEINVNTCSVTSFSVSGISSFVYSLEVTSDAVYFGGLFQTVAGQDRRSFAKVNRAGVLDQNWIADAVGNMETRPEPGIECRTTADATSQGRAIEISPDGTKLVLGGAFYTVNGTNTHSIAMVDASTGAVVKAYQSNPANWGASTNFIHPCSFTKAIETDGTYFYIGNEGSGGGVFDGTAKFSWSTGDQVWRDTCLGAVQALLVKNGQLYQAHHHHDCSSMGGFPDGRRIYLSATNTDDATQKMVGWFPTLNDGTGEGIGGRALTVANVGGAEYLWVGGEFTNVNSAAQQGLTRFSTTDTGVPATPVVNVRAVTPGALQISARSVVDPDDGPLSYILYRNNVQLGDPITATSNWWTRPQVTFVDSTATPGTTYTYRVRAVDAAGNQSALSASRTGVASATASPYADEVISDNPTLYWRYDDSGTWVIDNSGQTGNGKNGIAQNGVTYDAGALPGDSSSSAVFDGASQYIWNDQISYGPTTYSIETWFKTTSTTGGVLVNYGNGRPRTDNGNDTISSNYDRMVYMENGTGRVRFGIYDGAVRTLRTDKAYNDGVWHHLVASQGSSGMRLYIDGTEVGRNNVTTNQQYYGTWHVGGDNLNSWPENGSGSTATRFYDGQLDETAVYGYALTQNQAIAHYVAGGGEVDVNDAPADAYGASVYSDNPNSYWRFDESSGSVAEDSSYIGARDGVIGSGVSRITANLKFPGGALQTPGSNNNGTGVVTTGQVSAPSSYSLELWLKTTTTSGGKIIGFENTPTGSGSSYDKQLYMLNNGRLTYGVYTGSVQAVTSSASYNDGAWHHIVVTQDSTGIKLYVDNLLRAQNSVTNSETGDGYWRIGGGNLSGWPDRPSSDYIAAQFDEVAIYPAALTSTSIANHYVLALQDSIAPTIPTGLTQNGTTSAQLSWTASTDANGVAGYRVYRGTTADFTVSPSALVGDVASPAWTDPNTTPNTRYYKVTAYDAAGNESAASGSLGVTIADVTAPSGVSGLAASVAGDDVALTWNASTDDVAVDHYEVYRGTTENFSISGLTPIANTGSAAYTDVDVAEGTWYYRVVAVDAAGNKSGPGASAQAIVNIDDEAPSTPGGLEGTAASDGTVDLTWSASTDDVGVVGYRVYRGSTAGFTANAASLVADGVTATEWTDTTSSTGTRYYRVAAYDLAGNVSTPTDSVGVTVADTTAPSTPGSLTATAAGTDIALQWQASTDNIAVDHYAVYRGTSAGFSISGLTPIAEPTATTYTDSGLADGTWHYRVVAVDAAGNASSASTSASATIDTSEPVEPVTLTANVLADTMVAQAAANTVYGTSNQISARSSSGGSGIESYLRFAIPAAPDGLELTGATLRLTTSTDSTANSTGSHQVSVMTGSWAEATTTWTNRPTTGFGSTIGTLSGATALNTTYTVTLDADALASLTGTEVSLALRSTSTDNVRLVSKEGTGTTRRPILTLEYTPTSTPDPDPEPDTVAPSTPGSVSGTATAAGAVTVDWSASTDNVAVTGYRVYRGTTSGFTANAASQVGTSTSTSFSQSGVAVGTWYYRVAAVDAAGNVSDPSSSAEVVVPEPATEPVTVSVVASKDAMVAQSASGTNYGTVNYLSTRGGTSGQLQSFVSFDLPAAPAGTVLTSAVLQLRTTTDAASGSADQHAVALVSSSWTESTLTWANRPTATGASLGNLSGLVNANTAYSSTLNAAPLASLVGTNVSFVITDTGSDNLRFWSKDTTQTAYRPTLVLTYSAP
ncbi:DNRLRE domain-containing protein [Microbacterium fluvii]|uniref:DNRLRE domain-containing protein n=1 Tax=Microbacterium fluvii TaxID=415215 RepID=A0ABW2HH46_9MICO|nr:DNRLRE domain-containing protein [Microbacterium fluvii]MCU4673943.1 DNRLRE domain-containing protein [Microbacterium fluvii]